MNDSAQHPAAGLPPCNAPDLQGISLDDLAGLASEDDETIRAVVSRMLGDSENRPLVDATIFNSAI